MKVGDIIKINFGNRTRVVEVLDIRDNVRKAEATTLYKNLD